MSQKPSNEGAVQGALEMSREWEMLTQRSFNELRNVPGEWSPEWARHFVSYWKQQVAELDAQLASYPAVSSDESAAITLNSLRLDLLCRAEALKRFMFRWLAFDAETDRFAEHASTDLPTIIPDYWQRLIYMREDYRFTVSARLTLDQLIPMMLVATPMSVYASFVDAISRELRKRMWTNTWRLLEQTEDSIGLQMLAEAHLSLDGTVQGGKVRGSRLRPRLENSPREKGENPTAESRLKRLLPPTTWAALAVVLKGETYEAPDDDERTDAAQAGDELEAEAAKSPHCFARWLAYIRRQLEAQLDAPKNSAKLK